MKNSFLKEFNEREYFNQCTNLESLSGLMDKKKIRAYIGFDCTAQSLHVGSLLQIMCLRLLQKHGHQPIILLGGGTTRIGDPSGKEETRKILTEKEIEKNIKNIKKVFSIFLDNKNSKTRPIYVNNYKWLGKLNYIKFLREIGKHFTINKMLSFDSVKLRLEREQSLSFVEFNYMILQAYDFLELNTKHNCTLQIGGSDQWGNIVNGVDLIRRINSSTVYGLTTPLLTNADNQKMGKTVDGAVWLNEDMLSAYDYWQFWRNVDDRDVFRFLKLFTNIDIKDILALEANKNTNINNLKIDLANAATEMLHGKEKTILAKKTAIDVFQNNSNSDNLPQIEISIDDKDLYLNDLILKMNFANSKSEIRKLIKNNGIKINRSLLTEELKVISIEDFTEDNEILVSLGKKKHFLIKLRN